jgi:hypothetical protein
MILQAVPVAASTTPDLATILLSIGGGAVGAALIGLAGAIYGAWLANKREHKKWIRERRFEACQELVSGADFMNAALGRGERKATDEDRKRAGEGLASLALVSTGNLYDLARDFQDAAYDCFKEVDTDADTKALLKLYEDARRRFLEAARKELGFR